MIDFTNFLTDELLAAYIDGNTTSEESNMIQNITDDESIREVIDLVNDVESFSNDYINNIISDMDYLNDNVFENNNIGHMEQANVMKIYGEEASNEITDYVMQKYADTCAIKSQQLILEKYGVFVSEDQLIGEAIQHWWYSPGHGTMMTDVGKLLELHGVNVNQYVNGNIYNVINELAQGHNVIMGVDSGELWNYGFRETVEDVFNPNGADHALIVSGINTDNINDIKVVVTDPGTGDLCKEYSLPQFVDAAKDSNFFMVTTEEPTPGIFDSFGEGIDHLPILGDMTYEYFRDNYAFLNDLDNEVYDKFVEHINNPIDMDSLIYSDDNNAVGSIIHDISNHNNDEIDEEDEKADSDTEELLDVDDTNDIVDLDFNY